MGRIKILPEEIVSKIAAGEVIQRPASVVKELIENSIDAGAKNITVLINDAGKSFIQVTDDGCGMSEEDAQLAFERHATSKISSYQDLERIKTLGFRGEALASIGAVAKVELKTKTSEDELATVVKVEAGKIKEVSKTAHPTGTTVTVKNLFFNTPARRKFLKSKYTEFKHIFDTFVRFAIAYPEIAFTFVSDGETVTKLEPADQGTRIKEIFGEEFFKMLIPVEEKTEYMSITGFTSKPEFLKKSKSNQFIFVNRRFVQNKTISHAVFSAYEHLLEKGSYPSFILMFSIDPRHVDVNVHPSKLEAKFDDETGVYNFTKAVIRHTLSKFNLAPEVTIPADSISIQKPKKIIKLTPEIKEKLKKGEVITQETMARLFSTEEQREVELRLESSSKTQTEETTESGGIWQLHNKYILSQIKSGLMIIDQHVAHERILYERALDSLNTTSPLTQQLLFPQAIELTPSDVALVKELKEHLESLGFDFRIFGKNTVVLYGVPPEVKSGYEKRILQDIIDQFKENSAEEPDMDVRENLAKSFACKTAIKAGDKLTEEEMRTLINQLFLTKNPYVCPHGRPIIIRISIEELDKRFGRT